MKFLVWSNIVMLIVIFILSSFLFLFYLELKEEKTWNVIEVGIKNPMAKYFLDTYPDAEIQGYIISKNTVEKEIENIRKECGQDFKEQKYWKFEYIEQKENKSMIIWLDPSTGDITCLTQEFLKSNLTIPFGIKQERKEITIKRGETLKEPIFFYNINGNEIYYIELSVVEKPPWKFEFEPPLHLYKPLDKDPINMSVKIEPSEPQLVKPTKYPEDVNYIEIEGIDGFVKSSPVNFILETPKPAFYTPYEKERFELKINATARYFLGRRSFYYDSQLINYTIVLDEIK